MLLDEKDRESIHCELSTGAQSVIYDCLVLISTTATKSSIDDYK